MMLVVLNMDRPGEEERTYISMGVLMSNLTMEECDVRLHLSPVRSVLFDIREIIQTKM